tara:strand:- start:409 stop:1065 length:657 start_codon:yes stop_codon:yes gene_type:complete
MSKNDKIEVWGYNSYRPFRLYWILYEYNLEFKSYKIGSRTGETQTQDYLSINPKGKIPTLRHNNVYITESAAAVNYIVKYFKKPNDFFLPLNAKEKAKVDEWCFFSLMELDCLSIYILRRHENPKNSGLANLYGEAENALITARKHFDKMIAACEKNVPKNSWLFGKSPSVADIIFISCLLHCNVFNLQIKSDNINYYLENAKKRKSFKGAYKDCFNK